MTIAEFLGNLRALDVQIALEGDRLHVNAPTGVLNEAHRSELQRRKTEIIDFLRAARQLASQQRAIVPLEPRGSRTPIFGVAGHNGDVFCYRALARHLGPEQPFFGLQPPGLEEGSEPLTRVEDLVAYFAGQIRDFRPDGPVTIGGFCAGGAVAFELARELTNRGAFVTNLILFGAPYCASYRLLQQAMARARHFTNRSVTHARALLTMPAAERAHYLAERARVLLPREAESDTDAVVIRRVAVENATIAAVRAYSPEPFSGHIDLMIPRESWKHSPDEPLGWKRWGASTGEFVGPEDCNPDTMLLPEHAATFAAFVTVAQQRRARDHAP